MLPNERVSLRSRLGFIGLGYLGSRIARRLVTAGFPMVVYDLDRTKTAELAALGAEVAGHPGRGTAVHRFYGLQPRPAAESGPSFLQREHARPIRLHRQPGRPQVFGSGSGRLPGWPTES